MDEKTIAEFLYEFISAKYHINDGSLDAVTFRELLDNLKKFDDVHWGFNCKMVLEEAGITIDQFKKDFSGLLTIFSRVEKE